MCGASLKNYCACCLYVGRHALTMGNKAMQVLWPQSGQYSRMGTTLQKRLFVGDERIQAHKQFFRSEAEDLHGFALYKRHEQFLRLAPTSKKDTPHSCLISFS